ncbi:MAG: LptF/LptG family permease [Alphaproteobacteria bacterium]|nr:LptF/LptG family permease [Alphaproteobacteria bacterium]
MGILNKYFTKQLAAFFIMLMLVLAGLAWMMQILTMLKFLVQYGIDLWGFLGLTILMIPFIISIIMPFVIFIAVLFIYNKFIADREITTMAASGISPFRIAMPAIKLAAVMTAIHLALNIWIVPATQVKFYDTQWEMRYGLAHLKLQEATFTQMAPGLVVFVENVAGHDLSNLMLYDNRGARGQMVITAEKGKLVNTIRGLSIVMSGGSIQYRDDNFTVGTFDTFDMDMNMADRGQNNAFRVRRVSTGDLISLAAHPKGLSPRELKSIMAEVTARFLGPLMNIILVLICMVFMLKTSLLRRASFNMAAPMAVGAMAVAQTGFMAMSDAVLAVPHILTLGAAQIIAIIMLFYILKSDRFQS